MRNQSIAIWTVAIVLTISVLSISPLALAIDMRTNSSGGISRIDRSRDWSISDYSCTPEATKALRELKTVEEMLATRKRFWEQNRRFLEQDEKALFYYFLVAAPALEQAYKEHGENWLRKGFDGSSFFKQRIGYAELIPKLDTITFGKWIEPGTAYKYLHDKTGIPDTRGSDDFFRSYVWTPARLHMSDMLSKYHAKEIQPLEGKRVEIRNRLVDSRLCTLKDSGQVGSPSDCARRAASVKGEMDKTVREADALLQRLKGARGGAANQIARSIHQTMQRWSSMANAEQKHCPETANYVRVASGKWIHKFKAEYTRLLRQSFQ